MLISIQISSYMKSGSTQLVSHTSVPFASSIDVVTDVLNSSLKDMTLRISDFSHV